MIKIDNKLTYQHVFKCLLKAYSSKVGRLALFGSLIVYGSHVLFYKIKEFIHTARGLPERNYPPFKVVDLLIAACITFPMTSFGYYLIANGHSNQQIVT